MSDEINNVESEDEELSLRDSLEDSIAEFDEPNEPDIDKVSNEQKTPAQPPTEAPSAQSGDLTPEPASQPDQPAGVKPPASWSPKLREQFGKLDPSVQAQINKRENEISQALNEGAESRKLGENMTRIIQPFQSIMAAEGTSDPMQAIHGLLNTAAQLRVGSPQQKAQKIAELIKHYDVDIQTLDSALVGAPTQDPQAQQLEQLLESKLAPMQQFMSTVQQTQQTQYQQQQQKAASDVQSFSQTAEFLADVRNDMADLMDLASKHGQVMTLEQAYKKACSVHPEISQILAQRAEQDKILNSQKQLGRKRQASSSIRGTQVGQSSNVHATDLRSQISEAWNLANED